jgi:hypothetical protein
MEMIFGCQHIGVAVTETFQGTFSFLYAYCFALINLKSHKTIISENQMAAYATYFTLKVSDNKFLKNSLQRRLVPNYAKRWNLQAQFE